MDEGFPNQSQPSKVELTQGKDAVVDLTGKLHLVPCCIKYNGHTTVSHYFKPKISGIEVDGLRIEEAFFRGRKLHGTTVALPQGYSGFILGKESPAEKANASKFDGWKTNATFQNITVWNHDAMPSKDDEILRAFHWFSVANVLHQPVTAEALESTCID